MNDTPDQRRGRLTVALIWGLPLGLMLPAWILYKTGAGVPQGAHNHGILLTPEHALTGFALAAALLLQYPGRGLRLREKTLRRKYEQDA